MLKKINQFINKNNMFEKNKSIVVAVSGGVDSVCLLDILYKLGYHVILAHVNHHKRLESDKEEQMMLQLAKSLKIPCEIHHYYDNHEGNFHDAAHQARYSFFKTVANKYHTPYIATAHHLNDQLETIIMKLMTGSNLYGYGGISMVLDDEKYKIRRPLLCCKKEELYLYGKENKLIYFEDDSNQKDDYLRNRIRHHLIPNLIIESNTILEKSQEFSLQIKEAFHYIRNQSINYLQNNQNRIVLDSFLGLDIALQKDIICLMFEQYNLPKNKEIIEDCLKLLKESKGNKKLSLRDNFFFIKNYKTAQIETLPEINEFKFFLTTNEDIIINNMYKFYFSKILPQNNAKYLKLCYNDLKLPFCIRNRKKGDFINMNFGNKKVARLMIDAKLDAQKRAHTPIVLDSENNILWVYAIAKSKSVEQQKLNGDIFLVCEELSYE